MTFSDAYRMFRPVYPEALFQLLADIAPRRETALDCGFGTGQAAVALARHFEKVHGVDPSSKQIDNAIRNEKVTYLGGCPRIEEPAAKPSDRSIFPYVFGK